MEDVFKVLLAIVGIMGFLIIPLTIKDWDVWKSDGVSDALAVTLTVLYVIVRIAILAVKILVPYYIIRFLIRRKGMSRSLYALAAAIAVVALVTDGSSYRRYRKENPEFVKSNKVEVDEGAPGYKYLIADFISYEAGRMIYDLDRLTSK